MNDQRQRLVWLQPATEVGSYRNAVNSALGTDDPTRTYPFNADLEALKDTFFNPFKPHLSPDVLETAMNPNGRTFSPSYGVGWQAQAPMRRF